MTVLVAFPDLPAVMDTFTGTYRGMPAVDILNDIRMRQHLAMRLFVTINVATYYYYYTFETRAGFTPSGDPIQKKMWGP